MKSHESQPLSCVAYFTKLSLSQCHSYIHDKMSFTRFHGQSDVLKTNNRGSVHKNVAATTVYESCAARVQAIVFLFKRLIASSWQMVGVMYITVINSKFP